MCFVSILYVVDVSISEWNFSHVSSVSGGQTLKENPHIPPRTDTYFVYEHV